MPCRQPVLPGNLAGTARSLLVHQDQTNIIPIRPESVPHSCTSVPPFALAQTMATSQAADPTTSKPKAQKPMPRFDIGGWQILVVEESIVVYVRCKVPTTRSFIAWAKGHTALLLPLRISLAVARWQSKRSCPLTTLYSACGLCESSSYSSSSPKPA